MRLIILYSILDHLKPGTAEIRKILTGYIRSPPSHDEAGGVLAEVVRWKRAQKQARASNIEKLSSAEYLEARMGILRPLTNSNRVINTIVQYMEAEIEYNDPSDGFVRGWEERLINNIKMMRAGHCGKRNDTSSYAGNGESHGIKSIKIIWKSKHADARIIP